MSKLRWIALFAALLSTEAHAATETQYFKRGCKDFAAGRMTLDALHCVAIVEAVTEVVAILQSGAEDKGICIPRSKGSFLTGDYVRLIAGHPDLVQDDQPAAVGIMKVLIKSFPCEARQ